MTQILRALIRLVASQETCLQSRFPCWQQCGGEIAAPRVNGEEFPAAGAELEAEAWAGTGGFREAGNRLAHILKRLCCLGISEAVSQALVEAGAAAAAESKQQLRGHQWKERKSVSQVF